MPRISGVTCLQLANANATARAVRTALLLPGLDGQRGLERNGTSAWSAIGTGNRRSSPLSAAVIGGTPTPVQPELRQTTALGDGRSA